MITPIIIPSHHEEERCPNCGCIEDTKTVCKKCDYEYPEEEFPVLVHIVGTIIILFILWFALTILDWLFGFENKTLVEVIKSQWHWLKSLRIY